MLFRGPCASLSWVVVTVASLFLAGTSPAHEPLLAKAGRAKALIVVGRDAGEFHRCVAGELQPRGRGGASRPVAGIPSFHLC